MAGAIPFFTGDLRAISGPKANFSPCEISSVTRQNLSSKMK